MGISLEKTDAKFRALVAAGEAAAAASRVRRKYHLDVGGICPPKPEPCPGSQQVGQPKRKGPCRAHSGRRYLIQFTVFTCQPSDWDNCAASCKLTQDELVRQGWLPDGDGWRELEGSAKAVKCAHKSEQRTVVVLTRIA